MGGRFVGVGVLGRVGEEAARAQLEPQSAPAARIAGQIGLAQRRYARVVKALARQFGTDDIFLPDQLDTHAQIARGLNRAFDLDSGGIVATHCINGDGGQHALLKRGPKLLSRMENPRQGKRMKPNVSSLLKNSWELFCFDFDDLASAVIAAFRTNAMRLARRLAIRASGKAGRLQSVVRAPLGGARFRVSSFGIRHD